MRSTTWVLMSTAMLFLAGCVTSQSCDWATPIRPAQDDILTDETVRQILLHNEIGARICGWRP